MKPFRVFTICILLLVAAGDVTFAADPEKRYWYEMIVGDGKSAERYLGSSTLDASVMENTLTVKSFITLENLRELANRGDGPRWWPAREGEQVRIRSGQVLHFYLLVGDPKSEQVHRE